MKQIFYAVAVLITATITQTKAQVPILELEEFSEGYTMPVDIANAGDSRLFIVEQPGKIWICDTAGTKSAQPFLDITDRVFNEGDEQGLLGLAFHPDYASNGYFYVNYTNLDANDQVSRFSVSSGDPNTADPNSEMIMLNIPDPFPNHNGGCMKFGPKDGYLYISFGDGGRGGDPFNNAQNISVLLGKILRLDVDGAEPYAIPPTNPFINQAGAAPEIWAMGLRNPFRFSFDRMTGDLWIGDVGQDKWEEVDLQRANSQGGENYGWDCTEGHHKFPLSDCNANLDLTGPIVNYPHDGSDCTVIGGFVYRGSQFPNMFGKYIYCDFCSGRFRALYKDGSAWKNVVVLEEEPFEYVTFGEDINGELYTSDIAGGEILHVIDESEEFGKLSAGSASSVALFPNPNNGQFVAQWTVSADQTSDIEIVDVTGRKMVSEVVTSTNGLNSHEFTVPALAPGTYFLVLHSAEGTTQKKFTVE